MVWSHLFKKKPSAEAQEHSLKVGAFYNETTDKFLQVYGPIIQAFRTNNVEHYLDYTIKSAGIRNGMTLLDAGCGVCGPAVYIAQQVPDTTICACSISEVQVKLAKEKVSDAGLENRIDVREGDYHFPQRIFSEISFDMVYFLESFGHSADKKLLIDSMFHVLKPGGVLYIKDLFKRVSNDPWEQLHIHKICDQINEAYCYHIAELNDVLDYIRKAGFILRFVKIPEVEVSEFEHLSISNDFQNLFNIGKIESWDQYIFPIDFFEIKAEKPLFNSVQERHLYFMNRPSKDAGHTS